MFKVMDPCFIHGYESTQKIGFVAVKHCQTLDSNSHMMLFLFHCEQTRHPFSCPNFQSICDVKYFLKCLPCLLARALLVDDHPIPCCRNFLHHFCRGYLIWSTTAMFVLAARTTSFKLSHAILYCCKRKSRLALSRI